MKHAIPQINNDWDIILEKIFRKKSFTRLMSAISNERQKHTIFPSEEKVFNALRLTSFCETKVVIIGQDPYHGIGQAHGLCFSVQNGTKHPASLNNIFKELANDIGVNIPTNGNLENWANQGVLLLNTTLTVREKEAGSHQSLGWEEFTDYLISKLSSDKKGVVFMLWGAFAQKKSSLINHKINHILETTHPSPLSAYKGFLGCKHFSKTNKLLLKNKQQPIDWHLC